MDVNLCSLILHTNVYSNLNKPMFYFYTQKTSETQRICDILSVYRKEKLTLNGLRIQTNIVGHLV